MIALIAAVTIAVSLAMALAWEVQRRTTNSGWADVIWSFATGAAGVVGSIWRQPRGHDIHRLSSLHAAAVAEAKARLVSQRQ